MVPAINALTVAVPAMSDMFATSGGQSSASSTVTAAAAAPFSDLLTDAVGQVDQLEQQASLAVTGLMSGRGVDIHQAMIATQKASAAFEMTLALRNKAVQAYQQVISMPF